MTIEEAIDQLEEVMDIAHEGNPVYISEDDVEAIRIAKEALEEKAGYR